MESEIKVGDTVRVEFAGKVLAIHEYTLKVDVDGCEAWFFKDDCTVIQRPAAISSQPEGA